MPDFAFIARSPFSSRPSPRCSNKHRSGRPRRDRKGDACPLTPSAIRIAAEMVSPYPPGIPRIIPGQRITPKQIDYLTISAELGAFALDASDLNLESLRVVA